VLTLIALIAVLAATVVSDIFGEPPTYLVALLGTAAGAFFTALSSDKSKRDQDTQNTANRAEGKADKLAEIADREHPGEGVRDEPPFGDGAHRGGGGG